jgi:hypothetical protein
MEYIRKIICSASMFSESNQEQNQVHPRSLSSPLPADVDFQLIQLTTNAPTHSVELTKTTTTAQRKRIFCNHNIQQRVLLASKTRAD